MSARENFTHIEGNLVAEPELRFTPSGQAVTTLTVATSERRLIEGQWKDGSTSYFDVVVWDKLAEACTQSFGKGDRVAVDGRLNQRSWTVEGTDERRYKVEIIADAVHASLRFAASVKVNKRAFAGTEAPSKVKMSAPIGGGYDADEEPF